MAGIFAFSPINQASTVHSTIVADIVGEGGTTIDQVLDAIADLTTDVTDLTTDVTDLTTDVTDLTTDVTDLTTDVDDLTTDVDDLQQNVITTSNFYLYQDEIITTVDDGGGDIVGADTSIAIGTDDLPVISYFDSSNTALKVAHCNDIACTSAGVTTVDDGGGDSVGFDTSIAIGTDGLPVISYRDATNDDLKVAHCNDPLCSPVL